MKFRVEATDVIVRYLTYEVEAKDEGEAYTKVKTGHEIGHPDCELIKESEGEPGISEFTIDSITLIKEKK